MRGVSLIIWWWAQHNGNAVVSGFLSWPIAHCHGLKTVPLVTYEIIQAVSVLIIVTLTQAYGVNSIIICPYNNQVHAAASVWVESSWALYGTVNESGGHMTICCWMQRHINSVFNNLLVCSTVPCNGTKTYIFLTYYIIQAVHVFIAVALAQAYGKDVLSIVSYKRDRSAISSNQGSVKQNVH